MDRFNVRTNVDELARRFRARKEQAARATRDGLRKARPLTDNVLKDETRAAFNVRDMRMLKSWRLSVPPTELKLVIVNLMRGFRLHAEGGVVAPRSRRVLLIPINTAARLGTKKFYKMIDWLMREKLTVIKGNILYVKPPTNVSRRGGVATGTRIQKRFRSRFSGAAKRPSGFEIKLNEHGLTPIAVMRRSLTLRKRFDMNRIATTRLMPIVVRSIADEFAKLQR